MKRTTSGFEDGLYKEAKDQLRRGTKLQTLQKIIEGAPGPYVIAVDAKWGAGKTVFIKMLQDSIQENIDSIYINVWESDYKTDPMIVLISELKAIIEEESFKSIKSTFLKFSKLVVPATIDIAVGGLIKTENIAKAFSELTRNILEDRIQEYKSETESMSILKDHLKEASSKARGSKIVIFVDELDRSRPDYALEFLERIKHFFDLEGFIFVLAIDQFQLFESIKSVYGSKFDSEHYLKRFVDFFFYLDSAISKDYIDNRMRVSGFDENLKNNNKGLTRDGVELYNDIINIMYELSKATKLTARDIDQIIGTVNILCVLKRDKLSFHFSFYISILLTLRHINKKLYMEYAFGEADPNLVFKELGLEGIINIEPSVLGWIKACILSKRGRLEQKIIKEINSKPTKPAIELEILKLLSDWTEKDFKYITEVIEEFSLTRG